MRRRLDLELVFRGLATSREQAVVEIGAGRVLVGGSPATKASRLVSPAEPVILAGLRNRFVSRGGDKLESALDGFGLEVKARRAIDVGSSTGGFTDCLLTRGAASVVALDVGRGQLDFGLRRDPRVAVFERTNVRTVSLTAVGGPFDLVVADLSFISLRTVVGALVALAASGADLVILVKPQFEVGRAQAGRTKGVIRDPALWLSALSDVRIAFGEAGAMMRALTPSPLKGAAGNVEFLMHLVAVRAA